MNFKHLFIITLCSAHSFLSLQCMNSASEELARIRASRYKSRAPYYNNVQLSPETIARIERLPYRARPIKHFSNMQLASGLSVRQHERNERKTNLLIADYQKLLKDIPAPTSTCIVPTPPIQPTHITTKKETEEIEEIETSVIKLLSSFEKPSLTKKDKELLAQLGQTKDGIKQTLTTEEDKKLLAQLNQVAEDIEQALLEQEFIKKETEKLQQALDAGKIELEKKLKKEQILQQEKRALKKEITSMDIMIKACKVKSEVKLMQHLYGFCRLLQTFPDRVILPDGHFYNQKTKILSVKSQGHVLKCFINTCGSFSMTIDSSNASTLW